MGAFQILDLIIGMAFVYFLLSLICVALQEIKARTCNERSENLRKWVYDTFKKEGGNNELGKIAKQTQKLLLTVMLNTTGQKVSTGGLLIRTTNIYTRAKFAIKAIKATISLLEQINILSQLLLQIRPIVR
jgi:hypothetical protein